MTRAVRSRQAPKETMQARTLERHILHVCREREAEALAREFFRLGREQTGYQNAVAVLLCGFRECVSTWQPESASPAAQETP